MAIPDARVRLSAEGVDEVVRALGKIQAAGARAGGKSGIGGLGLALRSMSGLLPAFSVAAAGAGLVALTRNALQSADAIGKLAQKTGQSVETLSSLKLAAEKADVPFESLSTALIKFNRSLEGEEGRNAVKELFGDVKALAGLNIEQKFFKVAAAINGMSDPAKKAGAAVKFFGKAGAEMIPLFKDIADGGKNAREEAERLGVLFNKDFADAAEKANDAMTDLKTSVQGVATQFASGLSDGLAKASKQLLAFEVGNKSVFKKLGEAAGFYAQAVVATFGIALNTISTFMGIARANLTTIKKVGLDIVTGNPQNVLPDIGDRIKQNFKDIADVAKEAKKQIAAVFAADAPGAPKVADPLGTGGGETPEEIAARLAKAKAAAEKLAAEKLKALKAGLEEEARLLKATGDFQEQFDKAQFNKGLLGLADFYANRRAIIEREAERELENMRRLGVTAAEIATREIKLKTDLLALSEEQAAREAEIAEKREESARRVSAAAAEGLRAQQDLAMGQLALMQGDIANQVEAGGLFPAQAVELYNQAVQDAIPHLYELAEAQRAAATTPEEILAAEQYRQQIDALAISADQTAERMRELRDGVQGILTSELTNFFSDAVLEADNFKEAMGNLAESVVKSLLRMLAQMYINLAVQKLLGLFGGGGGASLADTSTPSVSLAEGGPLVGPSHAAGGIHVEAEGGEFMQPRRAVNRYGYGVMEAMRQGSIDPALFAGMGKQFRAPASRTYYAEGGPIVGNGGMLGAGRAGEGGGTLDQTIAIFNDQANYDSFLRSPEGNKAHRAVASENVQFYKKILNIP